MRLKRFVLNQAYALRTYVLTFRSGCTNRYKDTKFNMLKSSLLQNKPNSLKV